MIILLSVLVLAPLTAAPSGASAAATVRAMPLDEAQTQPAAPVTGVIHDSSGAVVAGATIAIRTPTGDVRATSGADGRFTVAAGSGAIELVVTATGFAEKRVGLVKA